MEDTKVLDFINKNHEKSYENHVKTQIRKRKKDTIQCIILILAILTAVLVLCSIIAQNNRKSFNKCIKMGHSYNYCVKGL